VLFAPGVKDPEEIKVLVETIHPKPFNLLAVSDIGYASTILQQLE